MRRLFACNTEDEQTNEQPAISTTCSVPEFTRISVAVFVQVTRVTGTICCAEYQLQVSQVFESGAWYELSNTRSGHLIASSGCRKASLVCNYVFSEYGYHGSCEVGLLSQLHASAIFVF